MEVKCGHVTNSTLLVTHGKASPRKDLSLPLRKKRRRTQLADSSVKLIQKYIWYKSNLLGEPVGPNDPLFLSRKGSKYNVRSIRKRIKYWFERVEMASNLSVHSCRHTYISHMLEAGVPIPLVRDNVGHSSIAVTNLYAHAVTDNLGDLRIY